MGQFGFADRRLAAITAKGDPLEIIARVVRRALQNTGAATAWCCASHFLKIPAIAHRRFFEVPLTTWTCSGKQLPLANIDRLSPAHAAFSSSMFGETAWLLRL
jgi:hypothetical protein